MGSVKPEQTQDQNLGGSYDFVLGHRTTEVLPWVSALDGSFPMGLALGSDPQWPSHLDPLVPDRVNQWYRDN